MEDGSEAGVPSVDVLLLEGSSFHTASGLDARGAGLDGWSS